jgi:hypothetical protein
VNQVCSIDYAVAYSTYCALACFSGIKSGNGAIDAHALSTFTSAVSSGHAVALNPVPPMSPEGGWTTEDLSLRSLADKSETGNPNNLRLRSTASKPAGAAATYVQQVIMVM